MRDTQNVQFCFHFCPNRRYTEICVLVGYEDPNPEVGGFFQELVTTISDVKFSPCGRFFATRDYLTMKIWDPRKEKGPVKVRRSFTQLVPRIVI